MGAPFKEDPSALADALRHEIAGDVRFDAGTRAIYATDASNYRQVPIGVVFPSRIEDIITAVEICREWDAPILSRGAGTSLAGQCCNVAVVFDMSRYLNGILGIDVEGKVARVEPGVVLDRLREATEPHGLTFAPDPATHSRCTIGGMIGNNSCGVHSVMSGKTDDNIESLDILTYDGTRMTVGPTSDDELRRLIEGGGRRGEIYASLRSIRDRFAEQIRERFPKIPRAVSGYGLHHLLPEHGFNVARALVGTEATCVIVLEAELSLVEWPDYRSLVVLGFNDVFEAADRVPEILDHRPMGLEGVDDGLVSDMRKKAMHAAALDLLPDGNGWLFVEFGGDSRDEADQKCRALIDALGTSTSPHLCNSDRESSLLWKVRESALGASAIVPGQRHSWEGWEDAAVHPNQLGTYLRQLKGLFAKYGYRGNLYGHFGDGCVHTRNDFDLESEKGVAKYRRFVEEAAALVVSLGGSLSGEHGDGQSRGELLRLQFGDELVGAFEEFKEAWDPGWKMNPGKVVRPYRLDENLRLGPGYKPSGVKTIFRFPSDEGQFDHAALRCVGVGACRREEGGTMCPSWMATHEEVHSTRGRARLLFEMLRGEVITKGWNDENVKEALDLCLACKGCKSDCPVNVDMATYKAEFLAHYYEHNRRPVGAYAMGWIMRWARLASLAPSVANAIGSARLTGTIVKALAGISQQRKLPKFARKTFRRWWSERDRPKELARHDARGTVLLWTDTFTNHFHPEIGRSAVRALEHLGFEVRIPAKQLCCGRPLYDFGFLVTAKKFLVEILDELGDVIESGTPIVGLEPSCVAVFRDELLNLFPEDERAQRLSRQVFTLAELLERSGAVELLPSIGGDVLFQGHCHQRSVMGVDADRAVFARLGMDVTEVGSGCCGMAGAFGFESEHYEISIECSNHSLVPAIEQSLPDQVFIADGFSCREQIRQVSGRRARHVAEVVASAFGIDDQ